MSERKYGVEDLKYLSHETKIITNNNIPIILKPSPGEEREGFLDPREELYAFKKTDEENKEDNIFTELFSNNNKESLESLVEIVRDGMGFPNLNLNTVEIITKFETISDSGNEIELWRYYTRKSKNNKNRPAILFIHGGAWIGGSVYAVENFCKLLAELSGAVVFNIDYSLAPEKPFPNGFDDCYYAMMHIYNYASDYGINPNQISIGGDSAGGNLTAAVCLKLRDQQEFKPALQILIYPGIAIGDIKVEGYEWSENSFVIANEHETKIKSGIMLGRPDDIQKDPLLFSYIKDKTILYDPYISPIAAKSHKNLPKTLLFSAEFDGLRIQTEFYAKQLMNAGVDTTCYQYKGMVHAFIDRLGYVPQAEDLCIEVANAIRELK